MGDQGYSAEAESIDGSAHLLLELASLLHAGRLDGDAATMARAPRAHREVGERVEEFARFADDQCQDLVTLLTALATRLRTTGSGYVTAEGEAQRELDRILASGTYVAPRDR